VTLSGVVEAAGAVVGAAAGAVVGAAVGAALPPQAVSNKAPKTLTLITIHF
jgi:hypothetical protein